MRFTLEVMFWCAVALLAYPYLAYPGLLWLLAQVSPRRTTPAGQPSDPPSLTLVISAYNESEVIGGKLANSVALDYPSDRLEVLVVSDASDDGTDDIVRDWQARDPRVRLLRQSERLGKTSGLNLALAEAGGELVVFSDANAMYRPDALRKLVRHFADPEVGYVVGAQLYNAGAESEATASEGLYWRLELLLKRLESRFDSVVGGDGAIYAIRRRLFWALQPDDINDFVNPLQIVAEGYRGVFDREATCTEDAAEGFAKEFRRKRRIVNRSWRAVRRYGHRLSPRRQARFLFLLVSHKLIRWFSLPIFAVALAANVGIVLLAPSPLYIATLAGLVAGIGLGLLGHALDRRGARMPRIVYLPYYYFLVNLAALLGIWDEARGVRHAVWTHVRSG
jgi:cellulose synthase/poly-beta-1,6-N-acetylglucosamine synthase-like glycosyltransferase